MLILPSILGHFNVQDSVTPLIAILYSTITNVVGDYILVKHFKMGLRGAAIATLFAQWAATAALLGPARKRLLRNRDFGKLFSELLNSMRGLDSNSNFLLFFTEILKGCTKRR